MEAKCKACERLKRFMEPTKEVQELVKDFPMLKKLINTPIDIERLYHGS